MNAEQVLQWLLEVALVLADGGVGVGRCTRVIAGITGAAGMCACN